MNQETTIFPLPPGAGLREQAEALAKAAWLMGGPDSPPDPPDSPGVAQEAPQSVPPAESQPAGDEETSRDPPGCVKIPKNAD